MPSKPLMSEYLWIEVSPLIRGKYDFFVTSLCFIFSFFKED